MTDTIRCLIPSNLLQIFIFERDLLLEVKKTFFVDPMWLSVNVSDFFVDITQFPTVPFT